MTQWHKRFMDLAEHVAKWSKDPSTKVGCVIVDDKQRVVGMGYNGFPRGVDDTHERLHNRAKKYLLVQHAEANAILQSVAPTEGCTAYVTHKPCANCTGILIQAGIKAVFTTRPGQGLQERFADSFAAADVMCREAGVRISYRMDDE